MTVELIYYQNKYFFCDFIKKNHVMKYLKKHNQYKDHTLRKAYIGDKAGLNKKILMAMMLVLAE